jgi:hypothetical protein
MEIASTALPPTGDWVLTPELGDVGRFRYRVVLEGVFRFAYSGARFDAVYKAGPDGAFTQPHRYLAWRQGGDRRPRAPALESEDPVRHRYVFRIPNEWRLQGQSVGVRVDVDQLVNEFLIPPSEVRSALSGDVRMTVLQTPLAPANPWPLIAWTSLPAALLAGGAGWVIRRRMAFRGLSPELQARLARIEQRCRAARAALGPAHGRLFPLEERLTAVREGAVSLARQLQDLRDARRLTDQRTLEAEMTLLQGRLATLTDATARREGEIALGEKRKTLTALSEMERAEARCAMRLSKIEAVLESTCLTLRERRTGPASEPAEDSLRRELDAEVAAIAEVTGEIAGCEALPVPPAGRGET